MMVIREAKPADIAQWSAMRKALWPESEDDHVAEINQYFAGTSIDIVIAYLAEVDAEVVGFIELNIRSFAEGSRNPRVPYVEGWYIKPEYQGQGYGSQLMQQAEEWALGHGYSELASDTEIDNHHSISLHKRLGFRETERTVCFLKNLQQH